MLVLPSTLLLNQCASTKTQQPETPVVSSVVSNHWVKVSSHPPTFYPRGVPTDCPTDYQSGDWIYTEDASDTRFFIPLKGIAPAKRQALVQEAQALRSEKKRNLIENDGKLNATMVGAGVTAVALAPVVATALLIGETLGTFVPWIYEPMWVRDAKARRGHASTQSGN
jgi:hypothetical protein